MIVRTQQVARMIQKALGEIFLKETKNLFGAVFITVTHVEVSLDLGIAKVYLSVMGTQDKEKILTKVEQRKNKMRGLLGHRIGKKLRKVPELRFYLDDSVEYASRIDQLLSELPPPPKNMEEGKA